MSPLLPLSLALTGLESPAPTGGERSASADKGGQVKLALAWARARGIDAVQLNAATPGVRPRDLDRSARRDLAATFRREGLKCSGLDLWIPPEHFADPIHVDRAVASVLAAIDLAHELGQLASGSVVSTGRPAYLSPMSVSVLFPAGIQPDALGVMLERAAARGGGVRLADHAWPVREDAAVDVGIDPAVLLIRGDDPAAAASRLGARVASARLSDASRIGQRIAPGGPGGRLDLMAYSIALVTAGYKGRLILDLRGVRDQSAAVAALVQDR